MVGEGEVTVDMADGGETVRVGIERLHLEQDAGKLLREQHPNMSLVDLNRSGVALMEIVSKPDLRSRRRSESLHRQAAQRAALFGHLRQRHGERQFARQRQGHEHEARRQIEIIEDGGKIEQETRLFDPIKGETRSMRTKEEAHDCRYFRIRTCCRFELSPSLVADLHEGLPELPDAKKARFMRDYALSAYDADVLVAEREMAEFFEAVVRGVAERLAIRNFPPIG